MKLLHTCFVVGLLVWGGGQAGWGADTNHPSKSSMASATNQTVEARVREPAVAGLFYPKDAKQLGAAVDALLAKAPARSVTNLKALVCPHAGYDYSGLTAATAYKTLAGSDFQTVIILAASHYARFQGASVPAAAAYVSPLGRIPISPKAKLLAGQPPFVVEPRCQVQRPGWAGLASKPAPPSGQDTPETWEHSVEVHLPFLQKTLRDFSVLPVVFGEVDPLAVARALEPLLDDKTLIVASTDLSHYHPYDEAQSLDRRCVKAICDLDLAAMRAQEACGKEPVLALMHLARGRGWQTQLLDSRNSGDMTGDKKGGVVGYAAIAMTMNTTTTQIYSKEERRQLLALARRTLQAVAAGERPPRIEDAAFPEHLKEVKGCFVTLTKAGQLRGCIGHIIAQEPLCEAVRDNARSAALHDSRFPPVRADEVGQIAIEISVLTSPQPLAFSSPEDLLARLQPHRDGVVLEVQGRKSTFLPQVWEQLPDKVEFLNHLSAKSGAAPSDWRRPGAKVSLYHVECFQEAE